MGPHDSRVPALMQGSGRYINVIQAHYQINALSNSAVKSGCQAPNVGLSAP